MFVTMETALDETDLAIIDLLRQNGRRTIADIAEHVRLSPAPVKRRIDRLQSSGVIAGYTVRIDHSKLGPSLEAFTELRFTGNTDVEDILSTITRVPEVREVYTIAGDPDALVRIRVKDVRHLQRVVNELRRHGRITGTKTLIVLDQRER
jgi:DNA-binding Lrp family transcriptional regulator